ncbi:MAG: hypothetical protein P8Q97_04300 [Myxococcota bacterium]|nr:hypothetical protein [Myxococcota bacterium]
MERPKAGKGLSTSAVLVLACLTAPLFLFCKTASATGMAFDFYGDWRQVSADASYSFEGSSGSYGFSDSDRASPFGLESRLMPFDETFHIVMPGTYTNSILGEVTVTQNSTMDSNEVRATGSAHGFGRTWSESGGTPGDPVTSFWHDETVWVSAISKFHIRVIVEEVQFYTLSFSTSVIGEAAADTEARFYFTGSPEWSEWNAWEGDQPPLVIEETGLLQPGTYYLFANVQVDTGGEWREIERGGAFELTLAVPEPSQTLLVFSALITLCSLASISRRRHSG